MAFRVEIEPQSFDDLDSIAEYMKNKISFSVAERWFNGVIDDIASLKEMPSQVLHCAGVRRPRPGSPRTSARQKELRVQNLFRDSLRNGVNRHGSSLSRAPLGSHA